jgi:hypothetical protein
MNKIRLSIWVGTAVVIAAELSGRVLAAEASCQDNDEKALEKGDASYSQALDSLARGCLGTTNDVADHELIKLLRALPARTDDLHKEVDRIKPLLTAMSTYASSRTSVGDDAPLWSKMAPAAADEVHYLETANSVQTNVDTLRWLIAFPGKGQWFVKPRGNTTITGDISLLDVNCPGSVSVTCPAYVARKDTLRFLVIADQLGAQLPTLIGVEKRKWALQRDQRWNAYHNEALFQWPWELYYNGTRLKCQKDEFGMQKGFCDVPESQIVLFHPDVALQWVNGAKSSSELQGVAIVEVVGRYYWCWSGGEMTKGKGYSLFASYAKVQGESRAGIGLMYHGKRGESIGLAVSKGQIGIVLSAALADRFFEASSKARATMQSFVTKAEAAVKQADTAR